MKIFIPFNIQDIGGPSSFAAKFKEGMERLGHKVTFEPTSDYDVLLVIVQCPLRYLLDAKKRGKPIVQRLDGVYYWSVAGWRFPLLNAKAALIRHLFADFTVYQSKYSKECCDRFLGRKRNDRYAIIYNGVDLETFSPAGATNKLRNDPAQTIFFTASFFRRNDQIIPLIEASKLYKKKYGHNFKLVIAGSFVGEVNDIPRTYGSLPHLQFLGKIKNYDLPAFLRAADVFVHTHLNPPCPNNVIEAMACGLPVCGISDGAMPELVRAGKDGELLKAPGSGFWRTRPFDASRFAANLDKIVSRQRRYAGHSVKTARERFSLEKMTIFYVRVFKILIRRH